MKNILKILDSSIIKEFSKFEILLYKLQKIRDLTLLFFTATNIRWSLKRYQGVGQ